MGMGLEVMDVVKLSGRSVQVGYFHELFVPLIKRIVGFCITRQPSR